MSKSTLSWLNTDNVKKMAEIPESRQPCKQLEQAGSMQACAGIRNLYAAWIIDQTIHSGGSVLRDRKLSSWRNSSRFQSFARSYCQNDLEKFRMSGLFSVICAVLVEFFLYACYTENYVMTFSADAVIGAAAAVLLFGNQRVYLKTAGQWDIRSRCIWMNLAAVLISLLCRLWLPAGLDVSLLIFAAAYFLEKRMLERSQKESLEKYCS